MEEYKILSTILQAGMALIVAVTWVYGWYKISRQEEVIRSQEKEIKKLLADNDGLKEEVEKLTGKNKGLKKLSTTDSLTGLLNRRSFEKALKRNVKRLPTNDDKRHKPSLEYLTLALIDLDNFKMVNDNYGHLVGDEVLKRVSDVIKANLRATDIVSRWGGEEICTILPNASSEEAQIVVEKAREAVADLHFKEPDSEKYFQVTISIGVACVSQQINPTSLVEMADRALYDAKERGKNRFIMR